MGVLISRLRVGALFTLYSLANELGKVNHYFAFLFH